MSYASAAMASHAAHQEVHNQSFIVTVDPEQRTTVFLWNGLFPFLSLIIALCMQGVSSFIANHTRMNVSVTALIIFAVFVGCIALNLMLGGTPTRVLLMKFTWFGWHPRSIIFALLPPLIFEAAFKIDSHAFMLHIWVILLLAVLVFLGAAGVTGGIMYVIENLGRGCKQWSLALCMLFGSIISATDPVAVLSLLHEVGAPEDLSLLIEGESLLNDGVAIILHHVFLMFVKEEMGQRQHESTAVHLQVFVYIGNAVASGIVGYVAATVCGWFLFHAQHNSLKERAFIVCAVYLTYVICELMHGSGVFGLVVLGIAMDAHKEKMSEDGRRDNQQSWEFMAFWANSIVFVGTGISCTQFIWQSRDSWTEIDYMLVMMMLVCVFSGKLTRSHPIRFSYAMMIWWGGLRGVVAILLALMITHEDYLDKDIVKDRILCYVSGCIFLSLSFQTLLSPKMVRLLKLDTVSKYRKRVMATVVACIQGKVPEKIVAVHHSNPYFRECNWEVFKKFTHIANPYKDASEEQLAQKESLPSTAELEPALQQMKQSWSIYGDITLANIEKETGKAPEIPDDEAELNHA